MIIKHIIYYQNYSIIDDKSLESRGGPRGASPSWVLYFVLPEARTSRRGLKTLRLIGRISSNYITLYPKGYAKANSGNKVPHL